MLITCAAYECTNQFGLGKLSLQSRDMQQLWRNQLQHAAVSSQLPANVQRMWDAGPQIQAPRLLG